MPGPLGVSFLPSDQQAQQGPQQAGREGGLQSAIQLLSLRYPRVYGSRTPVGDPALLAGNTPRASGIDPNAAIFQALINAFAGSNLGGGPEETAGQWSAGPVDRAPLGGSPGGWSAGPVDRSPYAGDVPQSPWWTGQPQPPTTAPAFTYTPPTSPPEILTGPTEAAASPMSGGGYSSLGRPVRSRVNRF